MEGEIVMKKLFVLCICMLISMNSSFSQNSKSKGRYKIVFKNNQIIECNLVEVKSGQIFIFQDDFGIVKEIPFHLIDKWELVKNPTPDQSFKNIDLSQKSMFLKGSTYKNAKIFLNSGGILNCRNLTLRDSFLVFSSANSSLSEISLNDVNSVHVATKNRLILGSFIGGAIALGSAFYINATSGVTTHNTYKITYGNDGVRTTETSPTKVERALSTGEIVAIVAGGVALGGFVGSKIKTGWSKIYTNKNVDFSFKMSKRANFAMLNLIFRF